MSVTSIYPGGQKNNPQFLDVGALWKNITSPHAGNLGIGNFKLPDFGISEFVKPTYASDTVSSPAPAPTQTTTLSGSQTATIPQDWFNNQNNTTTQTPSVGTGTGTPTQTNTQTNYPTPPQPSQPDLGIFDSIIAPALQALEGGVGVAQSAYDANVANANAQAQSQSGKAQANTQENINTLNQRQAQAEGSTQNAIADAQRGYSEMSQGIQAKFGGVTGTGAFADAILGGQAQRNIAGYRQQLAQNIQNITDTLSHVKVVGQQALEDIENSRVATIRDAKAQLDQAINNIRVKQGELQSNKAEMVANAIKDYRGAVDQANMLDYQFKQQLYSQQQAAEQKLSYALSTQRQAATNLDLVKNPVSGEPMGVFNPRTGAYNPYVGGQGQGQMILPGQENKDQTPGQDVLTTQIDDLLKGTPSN